jgi:hypothetical protein
MGSSSSKKTKVEEQKIIKEKISEECKNNEIEELEELNIIVENSEKDILEEKGKKEEEKKIDEKINNLEKNINNKKENNKGKKLNLLFKIHNYFKLYTNILHEQGFHLLRNIINCLNDEVSEFSPKNLFLNLTEDIEKKKLLELDDNDGGDAGECILFGKNSLDLKQLFYFSSIKNYDKNLSEIEKDIKELENFKSITEKDINESFFESILNDDEKNDLINNIYKLDLFKKNFDIKNKKKKMVYGFEIGRKNDKYFKKYNNQI